MDFRALLEFLYRLAYEGAPSHGIDAIRLEAAVKHMHAKLVERGIV